jgi:chemotaxis protein histidine kinase CheA
MRLTRWIIEFLILTFCVGLASAQNVAVSVGSVTKYTGIVTDKSDVSDVKSINNFLNALESHVAKAFIAHSNVDYLDRMNTDAVFRELRLSSDAAFNPNSGALRNLMGRLDFLIVIDASDTSSARIRLIDVESGAVKAIESCSKRWSLGLGQAAPPECVAPFVNQAVAAANAKRQTKVERQKRQEDAREAAERQAAEQAAEAKRHAVKEAAEAKAERQAREKEAASAAARAAAEAAEAARYQAEVDRQLAAIKPTLNDLSTRLQSHLEFWHGMSLQLASTGQSLRTSVRSLLDRARLDDTDCKNFLVNREVERLQDCVVKLHMDVEKLDSLRE